MIVSSSWDATVRLWDAATADAAIRQLLPDGVTCLSLGTDGRLVVGLDKDVVVLTLGAAARRGAGIGTRVERVDSR